MVTILLGIVSSVFAEIVTAINKKLQGTVLQGDAAFLLAFGMAFVGAVIREILTPGFTLSGLLDINILTSNFSEIFAVSQVYFLLVVQKLNMDVQAPINVVAVEKTAPVSETMAQGV